MYQEGRIIDGQSIRQNGNQEQGTEGEEDRRENGETTLPPTWKQSGLGQRKTEEDESYLRRVTSDSG